MAGMHVDLATISGGPIPWDPASQQGDFFTEGAKAFCADVSIQEQMKSLPSVEEVAAQTDKYDAIFIPGMCMPGRCWLKLACVQVLHWSFLFF